MSGQAKPVHPHAYETVCLCLSFVTQFTFTMLPSLSSSAVPPVQWAEGFGRWDWLCFMKAGCASNGLTLSSIL